jgi:hypothetical protein
MASDLVIIVPLGTRAPEGDPPVVPSAQFVLGDTSYSATQPGSIVFTIDRLDNTTQELSVDWTIQDISVTQSTGTVIFNPDDIQKTITVPTQSIGADQQGTLTLSNPTYISGEFSSPILGTPSSATIFFFAGTSTITDQQLRDLGYYLPEDYGAIPNDPTAAAANWIAIRNCILAAYTDHYAVWFGGGKTYYVNDTVFVWKWTKHPNNGTYPQDASRSREETTCIFGGGGYGTSSPKAEIRLIDGATNFQSEGTPRPVVCFRTMNNPNKAIGEYPDDPMDDSREWVGDSDIHFYDAWANFKVTCGNNPGAFGVYFPAAQAASASDITIDCSQALGGWWNLLGRTAPVSNLEIIGGKWQVRNIPGTVYSDLRGSGEGMAGTVCNGLKLIGDARTVTPIYHEDFVPMVIVGFDIYQVNTNPIITVPAGAYHYNHVPCFIDGKIEMANGGTAFDNTQGRAMYLRNVYVGGSDFLLTDQQGSIQASGPWSLIEEYSFNDGRTVFYSTNEVPGDRTMYAKINNEATISGVQRAFAPLVQFNVAEPAVDFIALHTIAVSRPDQGPFVNVLDYGAYNSEEVFNGAPPGYTGSGTEIGQVIWSYDLQDDAFRNSYDAFEAAIAAAEAAGHNRVAIPRGCFYVGSPGVNLRSHTKMFGLGCNTTFVCTHGSWNPTSEAFLFTSANDPDGTAHLSYVVPNTECAIGTLIDTYFYSGDWFSSILWQTGKNSSTLLPQNSHQYLNALQESHPKAKLVFRNNGGGKHVNITFLATTSYMGPANRKVKIEGTSQPLQIYGANCEITRGGSPDAEVNISITGGANVRLYGCKREGDSGTIKITDSNNIAWYGLGRETVDSNQYLIKVEGASDGILFAPVITDGSADPNDFAPNAYMLWENIDGQPEFTFSYPDEMISYYRRGDIDDSVMGTAVEEPPVTVFVRSDGLNGAYTSIQAAIDDATAGDIIEIQAANGVREIFDQNFVINGASGQPGNYITLRGAANQKIIVETTIPYPDAASWTMRIGNSVSYWKLENITFHDVDGWTPENPVDQGYNAAKTFEVFPGVHHIWFKDCYIHGANRTQAAFVRHQTHHFFYENCFIEKHGTNVAANGDDTGDLLNTYSNNTVFKNCTFRWGGHDVLAGYGNYVAYLDCTFYSNRWDQWHGNTLYTGARTGVFQSGKPKYEGSNIYSAPYGFIAIRRADVTLSGDSQEGGTQNPVHAFKFESRYITCADSIFYQEVNHVGATPAGCFSHSRPNEYDASVYDPYDAYIDNSRFFHNTIYGAEQISTGFEYNQPGGRRTNKCGHEYKLYNNLAQDMRRARNLAIQYGAISAKWAVAASPEQTRLDWLAAVVPSASTRWNELDAQLNPKWYSGAEWTNNNGLLDWEFHSNYIWVQGGLVPTIRCQITPSVNTDRTIPAQTESLPNFSNHLNIECTFANASVRTRAGFQLASGSPGIGDAEPLTTMFGEGNNTLDIRLTDPLFFFCANAYDVDEYEGVESDWISIGGNTPVQILTLDYNTGIGTISAAQSWIDGADVRYVGKDGNAITNIGIGSA